MGKMGNLKRVDEYFNENVFCASKPEKLTNKLATGLPEDSWGSRASCREITHWQSMQKANIKHSIKMDLRKIKQNK